MRLSPDASQRIRICRVICISLMVTVHFRPRDTTILAADAPQLLHGFHVILPDYLGRSSVPLLSVISGVLLVVGMSRAGSPADLLRGKFRSLIVPMVLWSIPILPLMLLRGKSGALFLTPMGWANALFALTDEPANFPLAFLRDIFLASVLGVGFLLAWPRASRSACCRHGWGWNWPWTGSCSSARRSRSFTPRGS